MKVLLLIVFSTASLLLFNSCTKYEGEGGRASVKGKIVIEEKLYINGSYSQTVSYDGATEDVYIVYGNDDAVYDDKMECSYDGSFEFSYLQPGTYTVFAYSEIFHPGANLTNNDDDYYTHDVVSQTFELTKKEVKDLGTITLIK